MGKFDRSGHGPFPGYELRPPSPPRGSQSLMLKRMNIEPGQKVTITSKDIQWRLGASFSPTDLIYVGSKELWILKSSNAGGNPLFGEDIPCDSFRPGCPSAICWPLLTCMVSAADLKMEIENRGQKVGHFIARLAGNYEGY